MTIGSDVLITAAHNVFDPTNSGFGVQRQGYAQAVQISSEFMTVPAAATTRFVAPPGYTQNGDRGADLAVIKLNAAMPAASSLVMQALSDQEIEQKQIVIYGYPELAPQLFFGRGRCVAARPGALFHTADAAEGESGGPFLVAGSGSLALVGWHRAGPAESPGDVPPSCGAVSLGKRRLRDSSYTSGAGAAVGIVWCDGSARTCRDAPSSGGCRSAGPRRACAGRYPRRRRDQADHDCGYAS